MVSNGTEFLGCARWEVYCRSIHPYSTSLERNPRYLGTVQKRKSQVSAQECQRQKEKRRKEEEEEKEEKERQKGKISPNACQQIRIHSHLAQK